MNPVVVREIDDSEISRFPPRTLAAVLVAAGFALSALGHVLFAQDGLGGYLWLPSGLMVAALLRSAPASWPLLLLAGLAGESANGLLLGLTPAEIADRFATTAAVALLGAILVRKFQAKAVRLDSVRDLLWFVLFTVAIAPLLGVAVATALQGPFASLTDFAVTLLPRWASSSVGVLALAPFLMVWSQPRQEGVEPENGPRRSEVVAMALATVACLVAVFGYWSGNESPFLILLAVPVMWAGLRFGLRGATAVNLALAIPAAAFTDTMMAPPDLVGRLASEVGASQAIVSILMILGPVLAAALQETGAHVAALLRSEQEIRRVGRLYASLSAVNHAVLTESTPESFLAATCRIIVEEGGLLLAAIGSVDRDQGLIVPLVYDGRAGDVVDKVTLPLRPGPGGLSPAAACVLEDEPQVCDDFLQDPRTAPWKQVAVEFNIRSSAALPVRRSDGVWGVLGLYANETGIFGSDELKLLTEIADIIGFALDSFAREQVRRETAAALGESEERFRLAMVHSPIGMALVATDGRWLEANPAVCRIVGYTRRELLDSDVQTITHAQDMAADLALMQDVLAGRRETYRLEKRYVRKDGAEVWTQLDSALVRSADGEPLYFLAKLQDITEQREARLRIAELNATLEKRVEERTQELAVANLELLSANRELEDFSSSVSHDLRSPLRLIDGFSQMLATEHIDPANEEALADIGRIRAAARRMGELIDSLLKLARNSRGAMNAEEVDLGAMAEEAMDAVRGQDPSRHVQLVVAPELRTVGSRALLRAVMDNLVSNAWKFTCHTADARIEVGCEARGGTPMFFVRDNGVGFDMRFVDQLFRPFHRLHAEHDFPGSGIGLATSRRILERHGGRIEAVGQIDVGASFYFTTAPAAAAGLVGTTSRSVST